MVCTEIRTTAFRLLAESCSSVVPVRQQATPPHERLRERGHFRHGWSSRRASPVEHADPHRRRGQLFLFPLASRMTRSSLQVWSNFVDAYSCGRMFQMNFLDADLVEKERWRYTALNQRTVEA
ncbi:unnamed protein product [Urochloa humidicola]